MFFPYFLLHKWIVWNNDIKHKQYFVLKQKREDRTDILIVDASKGFEKVGKNNKLRASDIKKIADTVINRTDIDKYSRAVSREEIRENQIIGGLLGFYNPSITQRLNGLVEKQSNEVTATVKQIPWVDNEWEIVLHITTLRRQRSE